MRQVDNGQSLSASEDLHDSKINGSPQIAGSAEISFRKEHASRLGGASS